MSQSSTSELEILAMTASAVPRMVEVSPQISSHRVSALHQVDMNSIVRDPPVVVWQRTHPDGVTVSRLWTFPIRGDFAWHEHALFQNFQRDGLIEPGTVRCFGRTYPTPRVQQTYCDVFGEYAFSGVAHEARPLREMPEVTRTLNLACERAIRERIDESFNAQLYVVNGYGNGHYIGKHRDNEPIVDQKIVYARSSGERRTLRIRDYASSEILYDFVVPHACVYVMQNMQEYETHEVVKTTRQNTQWRWSVTGRAVTL